MFQQSISAQEKWEEQKSTKGQQDPTGQEAEDLKSLKKSPETTRAHSPLLTILVSQLKEHVGLLGIGEQEILKKEKYPTIINYKTTTFYKLA